MRRGRLAGETLISATVAVVPKATEVSGCRAGDMASTEFTHGLNEDGFRQILTQCDTGIADLTNQTRMAADEADALFLTHTHFAEAIDHVRLHGQLLDANHRASLDGREGASLRFGATVGGGLVCFTSFHCGEPNSAGSGAQGGFCSEPQERQRARQVLVHNSFAISRCATQT